METGIVDLHGKEYRTVAKRLKEFRAVYPACEGWCIDTTISRAEDTVLAFCQIKNPDGAVVATGHAEEDRTRGVNKTSAVENAESSAVGRALAFFGFLGVDIASDEEIAAAKAAQAEAESSDTKARFLKSLKPLYARLEKVRPKDHKKVLDNFKSELGDPDSLETKEDMAKFYRELKTCVETNEKADETAEGLDE